MQRAAGEIEQLERGWPSDQIIEVDAAAVAKFASLSVLRDAGYEFRWVRISRLRPLSLSGWVLAFNDPETRRVIFMNRSQSYTRGLQDLVLVTRSPEAIVVAPGVPSKVIISR